MLDTGTCFLRFYAELNDFLPPERRQVDFPHAFQRHASIKDLIESLGIPHPEIDLIFVDGVSVDFAYRARDGDRISVYPMFEAFNLQAVSRVRPEPLRVSRFVLDGQFRPLVPQSGHRLEPAGKLGCGAWVVSALARGETEPSMRRCSTTSEGIDEGRYRGRLPATGSPHPAPWTPARTVLVNGGTARKVFSFKINYLPYFVKGRGNVHGSAARIRRSHYW